MTGAALARATVASNEADLATLQAHAAPVASPARYSTYSTLLDATETGKQVCHS